MTARRPEILARAIAWQLMRESVLQRVQARYQGEYEQQRARMLAAKEIQMQEKNYDR